MSSLKDVKSGTTKLTDDGMSVLCNLTSEARNIINSDCLHFSEDNFIDSKVYDYSGIYNKKYSLISFPTEEELIDDLMAFISAYEQYINHLKSNSDNKPAEIKNQILSEQDIIQNIEKYISFKGFEYSGEMIKNFYLSLKTKPFVILAGTSGTGKTRLVKLFSEAINAKYKLIPVRPDWSDSSDLFGHLDLNGNFISGEVIDFIADAIEHESEPYILCFDEMNLARVEYYFSDFLSIMETRERKGDRIITDEFAICQKAKDHYGRIYIPDNLFIVGTVNMDETTFPFSKKVLDRANTIEFNHVELMPKKKVLDTAIGSVHVDNLFLKSKYIQLCECADILDLSYNLNNICDIISKINEILKKADAHIGYRIRDDICFYMYNNYETGNILDFNDAMDYQIMQKILPRIQGSSSVIYTMLWSLFSLCFEDEVVTENEEDYKNLGTSDAVRYLNNNTSSLKYPKTAHKIVYMLRRYKDDGFTSYWM